MPDRHKDYDALSDDDKATYASGPHAMQIETLERRIERRLSEFRQRITIVEEQMKHVVTTSEDNNKRLHKLERFFWVLIGIALANGAGIFALLQKAATVTPPVH